jgi:hypothetical protein
MKVSRGIGKTQSNSSGKFAEEEEEAGELTEWKQKGFFDEDVEV